MGIMSVGAGRAARTVPAGLLHHGRRVITLFALTVCVLISSRPDPAEGQPSVAITFAHGTLSLRASGTSVAEVIEQIRRNVDVSILVDPSVEAELERETCAVDISNVSLDEGLRRILGKRHLVVLYTPGGVAEVHVYRGAGAAGGAHTLSRSDRPARDALRAAKQRVPLPVQEVQPDMARKARREADARARREGGWTLDSSKPASDDAASVAEAAQALDQPANRAAHVRALEALLDASNAPLDSVLRFAASTRDAELRGQALEVLATHGQGNARVLDLLRTTRRRNEL
jgi:hypothetical protein